MDSTNKIIRTICYFTKFPTTELTNLLNSLEDEYVRHGYSVQTKRICSPHIEKIITLDQAHPGGDYLFGVGSLSRPFLSEKLTDMLNTHHVSFSLDLTSQEINSSDVDLLLEIIRIKPEKSFNFAYVFNNPHSSPFFPSANYYQNGFTIGLQPVNLFEDCSTLDEWFYVLKDVWIELSGLSETNPEFLGIDSSVAPYNDPAGSLINFINKIGFSFSRAVVTDIFLKISKFIREENPKPAGLCGLMFPALEDLILTREYENGNFTVERNVYLSLHSGLGIDTYPIGIDESPDSVLEILRLVQGLSNKYKKPLSVRFVSDGKTAVGQKTDFRNRYLTDTVIRPL